MEKRLAEKNHFNVASVKNYLLHLVNQLYILRSYLKHGYAPDLLLNCALAPIVKDQNGDICDSKNYRAIAISSLILKIFDICILILFANLMASDPLQFGFEKEAPLDNAHGQFLKLFLIF